MKWGDETPAVRETYHRHLFFLAERLRPDGSRTPANSDPCRKSLPLTRHPDRLPVA